tara:strand:- start:6053 stop:6853 length:801 start_codon:yes stop_codon:yes gene_type:complete
MSKYYGQISKLITELTNPISYKLPIGNNTIDMNGLINTDINLSFDGEIRCIACDNKIKKTFMQGYCYPCFISSPQTSECILKPELCRAHEGEARDMEWSEKYCLTDQYIYLALTSNLKVGVTRHTQIPTRWIDQGAHKTIIFAKTPNRYLAGMIEKEVSQHISDKTYWRRMLLGEYPNLNLVDEKNKLSKVVSSKYQQYITNDKNITELNYPVSSKPEKIKSLNFEKTPEITGKLLGIKGQYLFFENDYVLNIRKFTGYFIKYSGR